MWFKNASLFRIAANADAVTDEALSAHAYRPALSLQPSSTGWFPPVGGEDGEISHRALQYQMVALMIEQKVVPASVLNDAVHERVMHIRQTESREVKGKERAQIKDDIYVQMLAKAFSKKKLVHGYFDRTAGLLVINSTSNKEVDAFVLQLKESCPDLALRQVRPANIPGPVMRNWLLEGSAPEGFEIGTECTMATPVEGASKTTCKNQDLFTDEVRNYLESDYRPTKLEMHWKDRARFILDERLVLSGIKFLDVVQEDAMDAEADTEMARFDVDFTIMAGEFADMLPAIIGLFGEAQDDLEDEGEDSRDAA